MCVCVCYQPGACGCLKALFFVYCAYSLLITVHKHAHCPIVPVSHCPCVPLSLCLTALLCLVATGDRMKVLVLKEPRESENETDPYIKVL